MKYEMHTQGTTSVVKVLNSRITYAEAPDMKTTFLKMLAEGGDTIVINLAPLEYIDSTGLGAFLFGIRQAEANDKEIIFCCLNDKIKSLVRIARLESVLEIYETEEEALRELGENR